MRKQPRERRTKWLRVRLSATEYTRIRATAQEAERTVSALLREQLGKLQVVNREDARRRIGLLNRINANLNMIARWCNTYKSRGEAVQVIAHLVALERAIRDRRV